MDNFCSFFPAIPSDPSLCLRPEFVRLDIAKGPNSIKDNADPQEDCPDVPAAADDSSSLGASIPEQPQPEDSWSASKRDPPEVSAILYKVYSSTQEFLVFMKITISMCISDGSEGIEGYITRKNPRYYLPLLKAFQTLTIVRRRKLTIQMSSVQNLKDHFIVLIYLFRKTFRGTFATIIFAFAIVSGHHHLSHDFRGESGLSICLAFNIKPLGLKSSKFEAVDSWKK